MDPSWQALSPFVWPRRRWLVEPEALPVVDALGFGNGSAFYTRLARLRGAEEVVVFVWQQESFATFNVVARVCGVAAGWIQDAVAADCWAFGVLEFHF